MPSLPEARAHNSSLKLTYIPVAVFVGGTGGIAASTAEILARYTEGKVHVIIAGRNRAAGQKVLDSLAKPLHYSESAGSAASDQEGSNSTLLREFVFCDASSLQSVRTASESIYSVLSLHFGSKKPRINYLVFSAGYFNLLNSRTTEDNIDLQLMMRYYHRFKMTYELLPLLRQAKDESQDAKVFSILASGVNFPVNADDFGFKKPGFFGRIFKAAMTAMASAAYNDIVIEEFASRERGISFTHSYPGSAVLTGQFDFAFRKHWLFAPFTGAFDTFLQMVTVAPEDCAEGTLYGLLNATATEEKGFYRRGSQGEELQVKDADEPNRKRLRERLFEHSVSETQAQEISRI